jgi:putative hydrolase
MIRDLHLHTKYSDGANTIGEMVKNAIELGIDEICFTDHVWVTSDWVQQYITEIRESAAVNSSRIAIRAGVEAKALDMNGNFDLDIAHCRSLDWIVVSMHRIPCGDNCFIRASEIKGNEKEALECWLHSLQSMLNSNLVQCIGHPFSLLGYFNSDMLTNSFWLSLCDMMAKSHCMIEYNIKYYNALAPSWLWNKLYNKTVPGSDSHSITDMNERYSHLNDYMIFS